MNIKDIKSWVINLDKDKERLKSFMTRFTDLQVNRFPAVNGKSLNLKNIRNQLDPSVIWTMNNTRFSHPQIDTLGAIGCYLSHIKLWNKLIVSDDPYYLIFEDDCYLDTSLQQVQNFINLVIKNNQNWDIIYLGFWDKGVMQRPQTKIGKGVCKVSNFIYGTHAYIINKKGAKKLLSQAFPITFHIDSYISYQCMSNFCRSLCSFKFFLQSTCLFNFPKFEYSIYELEFKTAFNRTVKFVAMVYVNLYAHRTLARNY